MSAKPHAGALKVEGDDGVAQARAREARRLGKRADLDRADARAFHLEDAVGDVLVRDERLVSGVEQDDGTARVGEIDPRLQLVAREMSTGGVARRAQVNQIRLESGIGPGCEAVVFARLQPHDAPARDDAGIDVGGIRPALSPKPGSRSRTDRGCRPTRRSHRSRRTPRLHRGIPRASHSDRRWPCGETALPHSGR